MDRLFEYGVPFEVLVKGRWPDATFDIFDVNSLITDIYDNPSAYLDAPANVTGWYHNCNVNGSDCVDAANPLDTFLWYDTLHPSERTGELTVPCSAAPLPSWSSQALLTIVYLYRRDYCEGIPGGCCWELVLRNPLWLNNWESRSLAHIVITPNKQGCG